MSVIQVTCPACRTRNTLAPDAVTIETGPDGTAARFDCASCGATGQRQWTRREVAAMLTDAGCRVIDVRPAHPERPDPHAPPLTDDDLRDFLIDLYGGDR